MASHDRVPGPLQGRDMQQSIERNYKLLICAGLLRIELLEQPETLLWIR